MLRLRLRLFVKGGFCGFATAKDSATNAHLRGLV